MPITITVGTSISFNNIDPSSGLLSGSFWHNLERPRSIYDEYSPFHQFADANGLVFTRLGYTDTDGIDTNETILFNNGLIADFTTIGAYVSEFNEEGSSDNLFMSGTIFSGGGGKITSWVTGYGSTQAGTLSASAAHGYGPGYDDWQVYPVSSSTWTSYSGMSFDQVQFFEAMRQFKLGNTAPMWTLLVNQSYVFNGSNNDDRYQGGNLADNIYGRGGNDLLIGHGGNDRITGGTGTNTIFGGDGNDTFVSEAGGTNRVDLGVGNDIYILGDGADIINDSVGSADEIVFTGNTFADWIGGLWLGNFNNDYVDPHQFEVWRLDNVNGNYISFGNGLTVGYTIYGGSATGAAIGDYIAAGGGADRIYARAGNDQLLGLNGNDLLNGGEGNDKLDGGVGHDTADYSDRTTSSGLLPTSWSFNLITGVAQLTRANLGSPSTVLETDTFTGIENVYGSQGRNTYYTNDGGTTAATTPFILGGAGSDSLVLKDTTIDSMSPAGRPRADTVVFDNLGYLTATYNTFTNSGVLGQIIRTHTIKAYSIDALYTGTGDDRVVGSNLAQTVAGGSGNDSLTLGAGDDTALFSGVATTLGLDQVDGGTGADTINFSGLTTAAFVDLATGVNGIEAGTRNAAGTFIGLANTTAIENITGTFLADELKGDQFANVIKGGAGNDKITGRGGSDTLNGEAGADTFYFSGTFAIGERDKVDGGADIDTLDFTGITHGILVNLRGGQNGNGFVFALGENNGLIDIIGVENAIGTASADYFYGDAAANVFRGAGGNDVAYFSGNADSLFGDAGNDVFYFESSTSSLRIDRIDGGANNDTIDFSNISNSVAVDLRYEVYMKTNLGWAALADVIGVENAIGSRYSDDIRGDAQVNIISGGKSSDLLVGFAGADIFRFAQGDSGLTVSTIDTITDFTKGAVGVGDKIDFANALTIGGSNAAVTATQASINATTALATFATGSGTTLADAILDIATRMTAATNTAGEFAIFKVNGTGSLHLFISDGVAGVGASDVVINLSNQTSYSAINLTGGDLTILS